MSKTSSVFKFYCTRERERESGCLAKLKRLFYKSLTVMMENYHHYCLVSDFYPSSHSTRTKRQFQNRKNGGRERRDLWRWEMKCNYWWMENLLKWILLLNGERKKEELCMINGYEKGGIGGRKDGNIYRLRSLWVLWVLWRQFLGLWNLKKVVNWLIWDGFEGFLLIAQLKNSFSNFKWLKLMFWGWNVCQRTS